MTRLLERCCCFEECFSAPGRTPAACGGPTLSCTSSRSRTACSHATSPSSSGDDGSQVTLPLALLLIVPELAHGPLAPGGFS